MKKKYRIILPIVIMILSFASCARYIRVNHGTFGTLYQRGYKGLDTQNEYGLSALMYAVQENYNINIIKFLLKSGADTKLQDNQGRTALDFAKEADIKDKNIINLLNSNHH